MCPKPQISIGLCLLPASPLRGGRPSDKPARRKVRPRMNINPRPHESGSLTSLKRPDRVYVAVQHGPVAQPRCVHPSCRRVSALILQFHRRSIRLLASVWTSHPLPLSATFPIYIERRNDRFTSRAEIDTRSENEPRALADHPTAASSPPVCCDLKSMSTPRPLPPIVYHPAYSALLPPGHRFSMQKYARLAQVLGEEGLIGPEGLPMTSTIQWRTNCERRSSARRPLAKAFVPYRPSGARCPIVCPRTNASSRP